MAQNLEALRLALLHSPDNVPLLLVYAAACLEEMQPEDAGETYQKVVKLDAANAEARAGLAQVALLQGRTSEAAVRAEQLVAERPDYAPGLLLLARILVTEGEAARARSLYDQALSLAPHLSDPGDRKSVV